MTFEGPDRHDYDNVASLNHVYLTLLRRDPGLQRGLAGATAEVGQRLLALTPEESERLVATPFLLFSFHEQDDRYWDRVLREREGPDLFGSSGSEAADTMTSAALGFLWQLAKRNPYALRVICGATLYWCERIADLTFYRLLDAVRSAGQVPALRLAHREELWSKLLSEGVSRTPEVRFAAQLTALQLVLTDPPEQRQQASWQLAARKTRAPGRQLADGGLRPKRPGG